MADIAVRASSTASVPRDYSIPGAQELLPKSVKADMDGTGAGSAWFPCLQVLDPGGNVMFSAVASSSLAAGVSADVSWFPRVSGVGASSSGVNWQHNDAQVANEIGGDFEDTANLTWTLTDDPANQRVKITPTVVGGSGIVDIQQFTAGGGTWTKPSGAKVCYVVCIGPGGGGGGAGSGGGNNNCTGGAAGGGGCSSICILPASALTSTVAVTVPAGASGGAAGTAGNNGSDGSNGTATSFGSFLTAGGGGGGKGSTAASGGGAFRSGGGGSPTHNAALNVGGDPASGSSCVGSMAANGHTSTANTVSTEYGGASGGPGFNPGMTGAGSIYGGPGGGGGGGRDISNVGGAGGAGGQPQTYTTTVASGGGGAGGGASGAGGAGSAGTAGHLPFCGSGGQGGGGGGLGSNGGAGGKGGTPGGGGGGGGYGSLGGAGGDGGDGFCMVISW